MRPSVRARRRRLRWKRFGARMWRDWVKPILTVLLVLAPIKSSVADWYDVPTGSMRPTVIEGDRIVVNKLAYDLKVPFTGWQVIRWGGPARGEVVVCHSPEDGVRLVKRVIGLPGDRVEMRDNQLIINGEPAAQGPLSAEIVGQIDPKERPNHRFASERLGQLTHPIMITPSVRARRSMDPVTVPEGSYLVLGDNRDLSKDSRWFGFVPRDQITGRAFGIAFSLDRDRCYLPRWQRFLRNLD
ncbi:MAG: signal peptidase I [Phycisphaerae bacterium]|nr:signal peptidase I [Phycisphaerae bacterium]